MKSIFGGLVVALMATMLSWSPALAAQDCPLGGGSGTWGHGMWGNGMWGQGMHGGFGGPFMMILFFVVLIVIAVLLIKWLGCGYHRHHRCTHGRSGHGGKTPEDILKERFARGEIDKADFEERRKTLNS